MQITYVCFVPKCHWNYFVYKLWLLLMTQYHFKYSILSFPKFSHCTPPFEATITKWWMSSLVEIVKIYNLAQFNFPIRSMLTVLYVVGVCVVNISLLFAIIELPFSSSIDGNSISLPYFLFCLSLLSAACLQWNNCDWNCFVPLPLFLFVLIETKGKSI